MQQDRGPDIREGNKKRDRDEREPIMRAVYSITVTRKSSGARKDWLQGWSMAAQVQGGRHKQKEMTRKYKKKENRLQPCSSIWPGQIRRQHPWFITPRHRCITWMARRSGSRFLIVCGLCASLTSCLYHSFVCPCVTALHPRGEARAHLAEAAWLILVDISGVRQINK